MHNRYEYTRSHAPGSFGYMGRIPFPGIHCRVCVVIDIERVERRFAETVFELGLMDPEGNPDDDLDRKLAEIAGGNDEHHAVLAKYAIELMDILDRTPE